MEERIAQLERELAEERERASIARSHHAADYEALRTQIVRQLDKQKLLLVDGLHAIRHGRLTVADEFVDRSLVAITREIDNLTQAGDPHA